MYPTVKLTTIIIITGSPQQNLKTVYQIEGWATLAEVFMMLSNVLVFLMLHIYCFSVWI